MVAVTAGLTAGAALTAPGTALADVSNGQFVSKEGLRCGGQQRITGDTGAGPLTLSQFSWIYYNCSDRTLRRKADIKYTTDGDCYGIGPGQARVLHNMWGSPLVSDDRYNGTKSC